MHIYISADIEDICDVVNNDFTGKVALMQSRLLDTTPVTIQEGLSHTSTVALLITFGLTNRT